MKKVLFIIGTLSNGGAENVVCKLSNKLVNHNIDVNILTYYISSKEYYLNEKIKRINISGGGIELFSKMTKMEKIKKIRKAIKKLRPDIIIPFLPNPFYYTFIATVGTKFNRIISYAERANPNVRTWFDRSLTFFMCFFCKKIIVQNSGQKDCFPKLIRRKAYLIPNFIDDSLLNLEKKYSVNPNSIVSVGRLCNQKNYKFCIDVIAEVLKNKPYINYYIYGTGSLESNLKDYIKKKNIQENVYIMNYETDKSKIYLDKDIFLMGSKYEGMPNALQEAMTIGIPAISTNCDFGPSDLIINDKMGTLLEKNISSISAANEIIKVIDNYENYVCKAKYAKKVIAESFGSNVIIKKWIQLIEE